MESGSGKLAKTLATTPFWSYERSEVTHEMARDEARHGKAFEGLLIHRGSLLTKVCGILFYYTATAVHEIDR